MFEHVIEEGISINGRSVIPSSQWIKTDTLQLVAKINEDKFLIIDAMRYADKFVFFKNCIELDDDYSDKDREEVLHMYGYQGVEEIQSTYGEDWKQILAECFAETYITEGTELETKTTLESAELYIEDILSGKILI